MNNDGFGSLCSSVIYVAAWQTTKISFANGPLQQIARIAASRSFANSVVPKRRCWHMQKIWLVSDDSL